MFDLNKTGEKKEGREEGEAECSVTEPRETRKEHIGREDCHVQGHLEPGLNKKLVETKSQNFWQDAMSPGSDPLEPFNIVSFHLP